MSVVKAIYAGIRAVGVAEEDDRRDLYERVTGKRRLREMTPSEKEAVLTELRRLGFRARPGRRQLDGPYARKLQALWIAAWNLGLARSRDDKALLAFVARQTGIEHTRWLHDPHQAEKAVEALKAWTGRAGVMWGNTNGHDFLRDHGAKIAWAQWTILNPGASLTALEPFRREVATILDNAAPLGNLRAADWRAVSNALGIRVRAGRA